MHARVCTHVLARALAQALAHAAHLMHEHLKELADRHRLGGVRTARAAAAAATGGSGGAHRRHRAPVPLSIFSLSLSGGRRRTRGRARVRTLTSASPSAGHARAARASCARAARVRACARASGATGRVLAQALRPDARALQHSARPTHFTPFEIEQKTIRRTNDADTKWSNPAISESYPPSTRTPHITHTRTPRTHRPLSGTQRHGAPASRCFHRLRRPARPVPRQAPLRPPGVEAAVAAPLSSLAMAMAPTALAPPGDAGGVLPITCARVHAWAYVRECGSVAFVQARATCVCV